MNNKYYAEFKIVRPLYGAMHKISSIYLKVGDRFIHPDHKTLLFKTNANPNNEKYFCCDEAGFCYWIDGKISVNRINGINVSLQSYSKEFKEEYLRQEAKKLENLKPSIYLSTPAITKMKSSEESNRIDMEFLMKERDFFTTMISIHYPFSKDNLIRFSSILKLGDGYSQWWHEGEKYFYCTYGLSFNKNLSWDKELINTFKRPPYIIVPDNSRDIWWKILFEQFPLDKEIEINRAIREWENNDFEAGITDENGFLITKTKDYYNKQYLENDFINLTNEKLTEYISLFNEEDNLIIPFLLFTENIYTNTLRLIAEALPGFSIIEYLEQIENNSSQ